MRLPDPSVTSISFTCNICNTENVHLIGEFHRERAACRHCGSTPRFRGIVHGLAMNLLGSSTVLSLFPEDKDIRGVGMSDWPGYADPLTSRFSFTNTYFHTEPKLDITAQEDWRLYQDLDFVICSEVLEHVTLPVERSFRNLRRMLKPGGTLVLSVPFVDAPATVEHFPSLYDFKIQTFKDDEWVLLNRTVQGKWEVFEHLLFHGGPGSTLEMRVFAEVDLLHDLRGAGFDAITVYSNPILEIGYYWPPLFERPDNPAIPYLGYIITAKAA